MRLIVFIVLSFFTTHAMSVEIEGTVRDSAANSATIVTQSDLVPNVRDEVEIFFKMPATGDEVTVGTARVSEVGVDSIMVTIQEAYGTVVKDQFARIYSDSPRAAVTAGPPAVSRGHQILPIGYQECLSRAHRAFLAGGYSASPSRGESFVLGRKGNHGAYITCGVGPNNQAEVNVFVATAGSRDSGVPARERERLQQQMNQGLSASAPATKPD